jgi:hypothetical protein
LGRDDHVLRYSVLVLLLVGVAAEAQAQRVEGAEVLGYGIYETLTKRTTVTDSNISTGQRVDYDQGRLAKRTSTIPLVGDTIVFGAKVRLKGSAQGQAARIRIVWLYPGQGLTNPETGKAKLRDEYETDHELGSAKDYIWTISSAWTRVPGKWTLQVWQSDRLFAQQVFDLVKR